MSSTAGITRDDRVRMERAHVRAWPAHHTIEINGWLWRSSGGGSQRANSVSTVEFTGNDPTAAIEDAEQRYRARDSTPRFQTFDETQPAALPALLQARGYRESEATITMFRPLTRAADQPAAEDREATDVECRDHAWPEWLDVYLHEISESRRSVNSEILGNVPASRGFFGYRSGGRIVSTALCVIGFRCAVIECVTTRHDVRRQGGARSVLSALDLWAAQKDADWLGLQVVASNAAAVALYQRLGFVAGATNRFWTR